MSDISRAGFFAMNAHRGQQRKFAKEPYMKHPLRVASLVASILACYEPMKLRSERGRDMVKAALLHDTLEYTSTTCEKIRELFGEGTASMVQELTSDEERVDKMKQELGKVEGKARYFSGKMKGISSDALLIKLADRADNLQDIRNVWSGADDFIEEYTKETKIIIEEIRERVMCESKAHQILFERIIDSVKRLSWRIIFSGKNR
ncbi:MAG: HD domain-containing protein [Candidatus Micrarchaeia archaeon]